MLRYAALLAICLVGPSAWAQQEQAPGPETPKAVEAPKAVVPMEEPRPGDRWTYEIRDDISGKVSATRENVVTEVTPTAISVRFKRIGANNMDGFTVYDRSWNVVEDRPWRYSPNDGTGIQSPLEIGKNLARENQQHQRHDRRYLATIGDFKGGWTGKHHDQGRDLRHVQDRDQVYGNKRQQSDDEERGHGNNLVRARDRSLGQADLCLPSQQASADQQCDRIGRIRSQGIAVLCFVVQRSASGDATRRQMPPMPVSDYKLGNGGTY